MSIQLWGTFLVATFFICGSPGPNMLMMMSSSVQHGLRRTVYTMAGCYIAVLLAVTLSVAGLGALLKMEPMIFNGLRYAGAVYLVYLGIQAWRAPVTEPMETEGTAVIPAATSKVMFIKGFLVGISNPKALLFAAAFFPQFINPGVPALPQIIILLVTFSVLELGWYSVYALGGRSLAMTLRRENIKRLFNRVTGGVFTAFGLFMLCSRSA